MPAVLHERVAALLARLEWRGMFELELIALERGGFSAIDFNPRVYGSLGLATGAGANLAAIWARRALGEEPDFASARPGIYFRREDAEIRTMLWHARARRYRHALATYRPRRNVVHALFQGRDPGPGVAFALVEARSALARLRR
jgi:predicted ATP-grasp superfamily ATP-dependent carboligase